MIPYIVSKNEYQFTLFAVWINPIRENYYKEHLYEAIDYYRLEKMLDDNTIFIGDFNIFAKGNNENLHNLEEKLSPMVNCTKNTINWKKNTYYHGKDKYGEDNYGINDFCFVSENIVEKFNIDIDIPDGWDKEKDKRHRWQGLSDHSPIIINIKLI